MKVTRRQFKTAEILARPESARMLDTVLDNIRESIETHIDAERVYSITAPNSEHTEFKVPHDLKVVPNRYLVVAKNGYGDIYPSHTDWTDKAVFFKSSGKDTNALIILWRDATGLTPKKSASIPTPPTADQTTASNVGTAGVGVFDAEVGDDLQFRKLNSLSGALTITLDAGNKKIDFDISIMALGAMPAITYGSTFTAGAANTFIRTDAQLKFPHALMPSAGGTDTLTLTQSGTDLTLTPSNSGGFFLSLTGTGLSISGPSAGTMINVNGDFDNPTTTLIQSAWATGALTNKTVRCWDARYQTVAGVWSGSTIIGYDTSSFSFNPTAGSGTDNKAYCMRLSGPVINTNNGGWTELATVLLEAPRRASGATVATFAGTIIMECPTVSTTEQTAIYIKQRTAGQLAANRYGIKIDAHNSGTAQTGIEIGAQAGNTAGSQIRLLDKAGDLPSPITGDIWRNGSKLQFRKDGSTTVDLAAGGGGATVLDFGTHTDGGDSLEPTSFYALQFAGAMAA
jgi:hypothetical protein